MDANLSFSKKLGTVKLILSSLFARKQKFLIVDGNKRNKLFFTTITPDRVDFYRADIDDQLMMVTLTEKSASILYEFFPIFKDVVAVFDLTKFLSMMNKKLSVDKAVAPVPDINQTTGEITFSVPESISIADLFKTDKERAQYLRGTNGCLIGHLLSEDVYERYEAIIAFHNSFVEEPFEREITIAQAFAKDKVVLSKVEFNNSIKSCVEVINLPIQDGTNVVSYKEYLTKQKLPWKYRVDVRYNETHSVAKVTYVYSDDLVNVVSVTPGALWFPFRK